MTTTDDTLARARERLAGRGPFPALVGDGDFAIIGLITDVGPASAYDAPGPWPTMEVNPVDAHDLSTLSPDVVARLWSKVDSSAGPDECWPFVGGKTDRKGYGRIWVGGLLRMALAHRVAYVAAHGPIEGGLLVCHSCDNPPCCNPAHLWAGTSSDNLRDAHSKGRASLSAAFQGGDAHWSRQMPELRPRGDRHGTKTCPESTPRGEAHAASKLTAAQVAEMRRKYSAGGATHRGLALEYGVSRGTVSGILSGRAWAHLLTPEAGR